MPASIEAGKLGIGVESGARLRRVGGRPDEYLRRHRRAMAALDRDPMLIARRNRALIADRRVALNIAPSIPLIVR